MPVRPIHVAVVAGIVVASYATLFLDLETVRRLRQEDGPFEYVGALSFLVAGILFTAGYVRLRRADRDGRTGVWKRRSLLLLGLVFVVGAGEEVSWGQRILGIGTPDDLAAANAQEEINVHNLTPVAGMSAQLFLLGLYTFVIVIPVLAAAYEPARRRLRRLVPIVPLSLSALFALNYLVAQASLLVLPIMSELRTELLGAAQLVEGPAGRALAFAIVAVYPPGRGFAVEISEMNIGLLAALTAWTIFRTLPQGAESVRTRGVGDGVSAGPRRRPRRAGEIPRPGR